MPSNWQYDAEQLRIEFSQVENSIFFNWKYGIVNWGKLNCYWWYANYKRYITLKCIAHVYTTTMNCQFENLYYHVENMSDIIIIMINILNAINI